MPTICPAETRTLIENVRWETYLSLCEDRRGNTPRMTYAEGRLELMSPRKEHEIVKSLLGRMIVAFCEHTELEILSVASTTFRREDLGRGFESDESYYLSEADAVRSKLEIDLTVDPPPELVLEVEITSPVLAKLDLLASMGVEEVWRHDGVRLTIFRRHGEGYDLVQKSVSLEGFPVAVAERLLNQRLLEGEISLIRQFRESLS